MNSVFKNTGIFAMIVFLCFTLFAFNINSENPQYLNISQYISITLGGLASIIYTILCVREKKWMGLIGFALAVGMYAYCVSLLLEPIPA